MATRPVGKDGEVDDESEGLWREAKLHKEWMTKIDGIEKNDKFLTYTPRSEQELFAELHMMREVYKAKKPWIADDSWRSAFMVQGTLVCEKDTGVHYFVVRQFRCAVLLWPAEQREINLFSRSTKATSLVWKTCFEFDKWDVLEASVLSPLALLLEDSCKTSPLAFAKYVLQHVLVMLTLCLSF